LKTATAFETEALASQVIAIRWYSATALVGLDRAKIQVAHGIRVFQSDGSASITARYSAMGQI